MIIHPVPPGSTVLAPRSWIRAGHGIRSSAGSGAWAAFPARSSGSPGRRLAVCWGDSERLVEVARAALARHVAECRGADLDHAAMTHRLLVREHEDAGHVLG